MKRSNIFAKAEYGLFEDTIVTTVNGMVLSVSAGAEGIEITLDTPQVDVPEERMKIFIQRNNPILSCWGIGKDTPAIAKQINLLERSRVKVKRTELTIYLFAEPNLYLEITDTKTDRRFMVSYKPLNRRLLVWGDCNLLYSLLRSILWANQATGRKTSNTNS